MFWTFMSIPLNSWSSSVVLLLEVIPPGGGGGGGAAEVPCWCTSALVSTMLGIVLNCWTGLGVGGGSVKAAECPEWGGEAEVLPLLLCPP